ncbi:hypothetical protein CJF32_00008520 [Rutstroemia sp. NJR-2017a WRK4]|nr:hypothetical protein CJF32_00008520 [Rutstroemia sp. NJR-2017a WRK4]
MEWLGRLNSEFLAERQRFWKEKASEFEMKETNEPSSIEVGPTGAGQLLTADDQVLARLGKKPVLKARLSGLADILSKPLQILISCLKLRFSS